MSYNILYDRQFIKLSNNTYIPIFLRGCNNVTETVNGRERRARDWSSYSYFAGHKLYATKEEIEENLNKFFNEHIERNKDEHSESDLNKNIGWFIGEYVRFAKVNSMQDYKNIYKNGYKNALTVEELHGIGVSMELILYISQEESSISEKFTTEQELLEKYESMKNKYSRAPEIYFRHADYTSTLLKTYRKSLKGDRVKRERVRVESCYVLTESGNYFLNKYTRRGFKYSSNHYGAKKFVDEKTAMRYLEDLKKRKAYKCDVWNVSKITGEFYI